MFQDRSAVIVIMFAASALLCFASISSLLCLSQHERTNCFALSSTLDGNCDLVLLLWGNDRSHTGSTSHELRDHVSKTINDSIIPYTYICNLNMCNTFNKWQCHSHKHTGFAWRSTRGGHRLQSCRCEPPRPRLLRHVYSCRIRRSCSATTCDRTYQRPYPHSLTLHESLTLL